MAFRPSHLYERLDKQGTAGHWRRRGAGRGGLLIRAVSFFEWLERNAAALCEVSAVHWAAHKLETLTDHALRHGEAVAIGMALDAGYAVAKGLLDEASGTRVLELLRALGCPPSTPCSGRNAG